MAVTIKNAPNVRRIDQLTPGQAGVTLGGDIYIRAVGDNVINLSKGTVVNVSVEVMVWLLETGSIIEITTL